MKKPLPPVFLIFHLFRLSVFFEISILSSLPFDTFCQKETTKPINEIDKLSNTYKDGQKIKLFSPFEDLIGVVSIASNSEGKPYSISITSTSSSKPAIGEFLSNTIKMKLNQGYKPVKIPFGWGGFSIREQVEQGLGWGLSDDAHFSVLLRKGIMFFTADAWVQLNMDLNYSEDSNEYHFKISTNDSKRQAGKGAESFKF
jgi:hypothetical protein